MRLASGWLMAVEAFGFGGAAVDLLGELVRLGGLLQDGYVGIFGGVDAVFASDPSPPCVINDTSACKVIIFDEI